MMMLLKAAESEDTEGPWAKLESYLSNLTGTEKPFSFF